MRKGYALQEPAVMYLLARQKERKALEDRTVLSVYLASLLLGLFMGWLFENASLIGPWSSVTALLALILVRSMSDAGTLQQLLIGGAWREIRLSRLHSSQVVSGILGDGLGHQAAWAILPACIMMATMPGHGLDWFAALALGSALASLVGQLSVVQRIIPKPTLTPPQAITAVGVAMLLVMASAWIPWRFLSIPIVAGVAGILWLLTSNALDKIPEGHMAAPEIVAARRWGSWVPWSENPIVARECARESWRLGGGRLSAAAYFLGWGLVLTALPVGYLGLTYWSEGAWPVWVGANGTFLLSAYVLLAGLIQSMRSAQRVFRALAEERDRQTLDLLVVTSLDPIDFVDGWAQVGYSTRQLEMALISLGCLFTAYTWGPPLTNLALIAYSGLVGLGLCAAGAYAGLLLGFRHCGRVKRKRHMLFPLGIFLWVVLTAPFYYTPWFYLMLQACATYGLLKYSRRQAMATLGT
ncbi:MAG: hypothetical protein J0I12_08790 [Candidatus Eremiobacteraeota bacterium]|nr:hypothetical protein [Candidatus Eremiobacteraeota bacterium]